MKLLKAPPLARGETSCRVPFLVCSGFAIGFGLGVAFFTALGWARWSVETVVVAIGFLLAIVLIYATTDALRLAKHHPHQ